MWTLSLLPTLLVMRPHPEWGPPPPVAPFGVRLLPSSRVVVPMIFPVVGKSRWNRGYGDLRDGYRHTGVDIRAPKMSPIVAPFAGVIGFKRETFWIYGDNGYAVLGTHLNDDNPGKRDHKGSRDLMFAPDLVAGQRIRAGQLIGYVGESGNATGPHLHFELYAPGTGSTMVRLRNPTPSLHMAQRIAAPKTGLVSGRPSRGQMRLEGCVRRFDPATGHLILILVSKQYSNGRTVSVARPRYVRLKVKPTANCTNLSGLSASAPIGALVAASARIDGALVSKLILP